MRALSVLNASILNAAVVATVGLAVIGVADAAVAQTRQIVGTAGYLSEWEIAATVVKNMSAGHEEFSGPIVWKHIGLCSVNGPQEFRGEIATSIRRSWLASKFEANLSLNGDECTFSGDFSDEHQRAHGLRQSQGRSADAYGSARRVPSGMRRRHAASPLGIEPGVGKLRRIMIHHNAARVTRIRNNCSQPKVVARSHSQFQSIW